MNKSRKATLLHVLQECGNYEGIEIYRTPGEEAAIQIAARLIERATLKELDAIAKGRKFAEPFWSKQW
jgi:hypothetical protein